MALTPAKKAFVRHLVVKASEEKDNERTGAKTGSCLTDREFAEAIGVHFNTVGNWKRDPEVLAAYEAALREYETSKDYFKSCIRARAIEELWVNYQKSSEPSRRHYLDMILKETADVAASDEVVDFSEMSDEDLVNACLQRDLSVLGMTQAQLASLAKGESWSGSSESEPSCAESEVSQEDSTSDGTCEIKPVFTPGKPGRPRKKRKYTRRSNSPSSTTT